MIEIFVFGSNLAGRHGKGAALDAVKHYGAVYGQGIGIQGRSYAIPTKDSYLKTLPLATIKLHVEDFIRYAKINTTQKFKVTPIGTGLVGYKHRDIAPMFKDVPNNCIMPKEWEEYL